MKYFVFNILSFLLAFCMGLFYVYMKSPDERKIIKYPTPYNTHKITYMGENGDCYRFKTEEIKCSNDYVDQPII